MSPWQVVSSWRYQRELSHYQADTQGLELRKETGASSRGVLAEAAGFPHEEGGGGEAGRRECGLGPNTHQKGRRRKKLTEAAKTEISEGANQRDDNRRLGCHQETGVAGCLQPG